LGGTRELLAGKGLIKAVCCAKGEADFAKRCRQNQTLNFKHKFINNLSNVRSTLCSHNFVPQGFFGQPGGSRDALPVSYRHTGTTAGV
jgi:hypothetical protein